MTSLLQAGNMPATSLQKCVDYASFLQACFVQENFRLYCRLLLRIVKHQIIYSQYADRSVIVK